MSCVFLGALAWVVSGLSLAPGPAHVLEETPCSGCEILELHLEADPEDLELLYTRSPTSDDRIPGVARLEADGEPLALQGFRFRGSSSRFLPKKSFNIRFAERQDFLFGSSRMNLNAMYTDPSMMRERLAFDMFHELGRPASRTRYFRLYINGIYEGLYIHIERVDEDLLENAGIEEPGTLVRDGFRDFSHLPEIGRRSLFGFDLDQVEDPEGLLMQTFDSRGNPDWSALAELARWVFNTPAGPDFAEGFQERIDLATFVDWLAIHFLIGDIDAFGDDYWLFLAHDDPQARWAIIPWDKDLSFGSHSRPEIGLANDFFAYDYPLAGGWDNDLVHKFLATPSLRTLLYERLQLLMEEVFTEAYWKERTSEIGGLIQESVHRSPGPDAFLLHPQNHHGELGRHPFHRENLRDFVALRWAFIRNWIELPPGTTDTATVDLRDHAVGDSVFFTDAAGWTIARLELREMQDPGAVTVTVASREGLDGVDRVWTIETGSGRIAGDLSLFYRNDVPWFLTDENWYQEPVATGRQWALVMGELPLDGRDLPFPHVNPYSNKVTARVELSGIQQFVLIHDPEKTGRRALFAAFLVGNPFVPEQGSAETSFSISNIQASPQGSFFHSLSRGGVEAGTIEFYLWGQDGEVLAYETGPGSPGFGLDGEGRLLPGHTYTVQLGDILDELAVPGPFVGYGWIVANFDGVQGTYAISGIGGTPSFPLQPGLGKHRFFGGIPIAAADP